MKTKIAIIIILILISCDNVFSQNEVKQSSPQKVDVPLLTVKNKSIEYVLDTVISFMHNTDLNYTLVQHVPEKI